VFANPLSILAPDFFTFFTFTQSNFHTFGKGHDGCEPEGNLAIDQKGNLYGGTVLGGAHGYGMVFELTP
jgi:uncharacterized repeat protein (TIGR03803 family)